MVKKGLEARPVGLRVSLCLCPEEQPALPAAVAGCFPTLPIVSAAQITPSGADPPERGNTETDEWGEEGRKREKRMGFISWVLLWLTREYCTPWWMGCLQTPVCLRRWTLLG